MVVLFDLNLKRLMPGILLSSQKSYMLDVFVNWVAFVALLAHVLNSTLNFRGDLVFYQHYRHSILFLLFSPLWKN